MTNKSGRTSQSTNNLGDELIFGRTRSCDKGSCVSLRNKNAIVGINVFNKK